MRRIGGVLLALMVVGCGGGGDDEKPRTATYRVFSPNAVVVTYRLGSSIQQERVTPVFGWSKVATTSARPGDFFSVSAQNQGASGSVTVSISFDGQTAAAASSSAPFGVASTSATCCD
jgi:hypothetical protein